MAEGEEQQIGESKEQKFARLATKRTQAALDKIRLLGNLTSGSYSYTEEQANRILTGLRVAVDEIEGKFRRVRGQKISKDKFSL